MNNEKIEQLSSYEQNLQNLLSQRQNFQTQLMEVQSAIKETQNSKEVYKIIGNIMVLSDNSKIKEELKDKEEMLNIRIKNIQKKEEELKEKSKVLQEEIFKEVKKKDMVK